MTPTRSSRSAALVLTLTLLLSIAAPAFASATRKIQEAPAQDQDKVTLDTKGRSIKESLKNRDGRKDFTSAELEEMRAALLAMLTTTYYATPLFEKGHATGQTADDYAEISNRIKQLTEAELTTFRAALNPVSMQQQLQTALDKINGVKMRSAFTKTAGLPTSDYYCKGQTLMLGISSPVSPETLSGSDDIFFIAEGVRDLAQNACNQVAVVVVLGEGGGANTRLLCNISDAVYLVAKVLNQKYHFCDDNEDSEDIGSIQGGISHLNTDIANGISSTATAITASQTAITNNDNTNKTTIVNNSNTIKDTIIADSNTHYVALNNTINAALSSIISNANANKDEVKNLLLRTQIEADLSVNDGQPWVALYQMPATTCFPALDSAGLPVAFPLQCGLLDLVRAIVVQTIAKTGNNANALKVLAKADSYRAQGKFSDSYKLYRNAYKEALK